MSMSKRENATPEKILHTHTQPFNGLLSGTTRVGRYQRNIIILQDFCGTGGDNGGRGTGSPCGRHPIRTNDTPTPTTPHVFTGRMPFLPPNQQRQSTEGVKRFLLGLSPLALAQTI